MAIFEKEKKSVNIKMMITAEKIIANIDKVKKILNPNSKKRIIDVSTDSYFRDLVDSVTQYLKDYPNKNNFPMEVYKEAYGLVEYATDLFEINNKKVEDLIAQREVNIKLSILLNEALETVTAKEANWIDKLVRYEGRFDSNTADALTIIANDAIKTKEEVDMAEKVVKAKISNLEQNLHIDLEMERTELNSKALSHIGIQVAEALKSIPTPKEHEVSAIEVENIDNALAEEIKELSIQQIVKDEVLSNDKLEEEKAKKKAVDSQNFLTEDTKDDNSVKDEIKESDEAKALANKYNELTADAKMQNNPLDTVLTETVKINTQEINDSLNEKSKTDEKAEKSETSETIDSIDDLVSENTDKKNENKSVIEDKVSTQKTIPISQQKIFDETELNNKNEINETNANYYDVPKENKKGIFSKISNLFKSMFSMNSKQKALPEFNK